MITKTKMHEVKKTTNLARDYLKHEPFKAVMIPES
jgi:hypothetical protein